MKERILPAAMIALALIMGGFLAGGRYTIARDNELVVWRLDRYTGEVSMCGGVAENGNVLGCSALAEGQARQRTSN